MIGITETYDPCFIPDWDKKLLDANIIISKELTDDMIEKLVANQDKIIFHHTVTGLGGTLYEPNVKSFIHEAKQAEKLFSAGFPKDHYVLRIDPIIPDPAQVADIRDVLELWLRKFGDQGAYVRNEDLPNKIRCRISVIDMYDHVKIRLLQAGCKIDYCTFNAPRYVFKELEKFLSGYKTVYQFECCAEPNFTAYFIEHVGCASNKDMKILGLPDGELPEKPQRRTCLCLAKKQILGVKPRRCPHQCLYCFWKD